MEKVLLSIGILWGAISCAPKLDSLFYDEAFIKESNWNEEAFRKIRSQPNGTLSFGIVADTHQSYEDLESVVQIFNSRQDLDFAVHLGDFTDLGNSLEYTYFIEMIRKLRIPLFVVLGNHDAIGDGKSIFEDVFGPRNQSFQTPSFQLIFLDANTLETGPIDWPWLDHELKSSALPKLLFRHTNYDNPDYFSKKEVQHFRKALENAGTVIVFQAHRDSFGFQQINKSLIVQIPSVDRQVYIHVDISADSLTISKCQRDRCEEAFHHPLNK